jgi:hypothetical protein
MKHCTMLIGVREILCLVKVYPFLSKWSYWVFTRGSFASPMKHCTMLIGVREILCLVKIFWSNDLSYVILFFTYDTLYLIPLLNSFLNNLSIQQLSITIGFTISVSKFNSWRWFYQFNFPKTSKIEYIKNMYCMVTNVYMYGDQCMVVVC